MLFGIKYAISKYYLAYIFSILEDSFEALKLLENIASYQIPDRRKIFLIKIAHFERQKKSVTEFQGKKLTNKTFN